MKIKVKKEKLLNELQTAQDIISSKSSKMSFSILTNVLLEAKDGLLTLKATDLNIGFETKIPVDVETEGSITVFCDRLFNSIRSLPEGDIDIYREKDILNISPEGKKIEFKLRCVESDRFPEIKEIDESLYFEISQKEFVEMISYTIFSVSGDETRYYMNGVYMEKLENKLVMVSTDARRLSYIHKEFSEEIPNFPGIIIPTKILNLLRKLSIGEGKIGLAVKEGTIFIKLNNHRLYSTLIDGNFPNYNAVIPKDNPHKIIADRNELLDGIKRVSILAEEKSRKIILTFRESSILLEAEESNIGNVFEEIDCEEYSGEDIKLEFNYNYIIEPLREIDEDKVVIYFSTTNKAIMIKSLPEKDYLYIVMPMYNV